MCAWQAGGFHEAISAPCRHDHDARCAAPCGKRSSGGQICGARAPGRGAHLTPLFSVGIGCGEPCVVENCPVQVGALAACHVEARNQVCDPPCFWDYDDTLNGHEECNCSGVPWNQNRRLAASAAQAASPWRDGAVDVLSVACAPGSADSPACESEEGVMDALHDKVRGHYVWMQAEHEAAAHNAAAYQAAPASSSK
jgi:hypothetical protein